MLAKVQDYSGRRSYTTNASQHQQPSNGSQKRKSPYICADQLPEGRLRLTASLPASRSPARPLQPPAKFSLDCVIFPLIHALLPKALTPFLLRIALLMERVAQLSDTAGSLYSLLSSGCKCPEGREVLASLAWS